MEGFLVACKNGNGGVGNREHGADYLETTFFAVVALSVLGGTRSVGADTVGYVLSKETDRGGFGESSDGPANLFNTFYASCCLKLTGALDPLTRARTARYIQERVIRPDGIFDTHVGETSTTSVYWAVSTLKALAADYSSLRDSSAEFLSSCYLPEGLFAPVPGGIGTIQNTFEALVVLRELAALGSVDVEKTTEAIERRKIGPLYVDDLLRRTSLSSTMWALAALNLVGTLDRTQNYDTLHLANEVLRRMRYVFDVFCAVNIVANMSFEPGRVNVRKSTVLRETNGTDVLRTIADVIKRLRSNGIPLSSNDFSRVLKKSGKGMDFAEEFVQIVLSPNEQRMYEIEYSGDRPLGLSTPVTRVARECLSVRTLPRDRLRMLAVLDPTSDLTHSLGEREIIRSYCKNNLIVQADDLLGENVTYARLRAALEGDYQIFYYSGHAEEGALRLHAGEIRISELLEILREKGCFIAILNCCDTYDYVKSKFLAMPELGEHFNVICSLTDIDDDIAKWFIIHLLYYFELGIPIAEAVRLAKREIYLMTEGRGATWWSYVLFGNPYTVLG